jgi:cardiolipin synthase
MLRIRSAALAKEARRTFEGDLDHSVRVKPLSWRKPSNWWQRLKQKLARFIFTRLDLGVAQYFAQRREAALRRSSSHGSTL